MTGYSRMILLSQSRIKSVIILLRSRRFLNDEMKRVLQMALRASVRSRQLHGWAENSVSPRCKIVLAVVSRGPAWIIYCWPAGFRRFFHLVYLKTVLRRHAFWAWRFEPDGLDTTVRFLSMSGKDVLIVWLPWNCKVCRLRYSRRISLFRSHSPV